MVFCAPTSMGKWEGLGYNCCANPFWSCRHEVLQLNAVFYMWRVRTVLTIISSELVMPCDPMPLSLNPWKGKWSGPRAGALFTCTPRQVFPMTATDSKLMGRVTSIAPACQEVLQQS